MAGSISLIRATIGRIRRICRSLELPKIRIRPSEARSVTAFIASVVLSQISLSSSIACLASLRFPPSGRFKSILTIILHHPSVIGQADRPGPVLAQFDRTPGRPPLANPASGSIRRRNWVRSVAMLGFDRAAADLASSRRRDRVRSVAGPWLRPVGKVGFAPSSRLASIRQPSAIGALFPPRSHPSCDAPPSPPTRPGRPRFRDPPDMFSRRGLGRTHWPPRSVKNPPNLRYAFNMGAMGELGGEVLAGFLRNWVDHGRDTAYNPARGERRIFPRGALRLMISSLLFSLSALCFVGMLIPRRPTQPCRSLETYYVCDPGSLPTPETEVASSALAGEPRG